MTDVRVSPLAKSREAVTSLFLKKTSQLDCLPVRVSTNL